MTDTFSFRGYFGRAMNTFCHLGERNSKSTNLESAVMCHNVNAELLADQLIVQFWGENAARIQAILYKEPTRCNFGSIVY